MAPLPVYSKRFFWEHNHSGANPFTNGTGNTLIIRNFTAYYGGSSADSLFLVDEADGAMLFTTAPGSLSGPPSWFQIWEELHLVWPAGVTWSVNTGNGWDYSAHGYELSG